MLKPLEEYICDVCGKTIESKGNGMLTAQRNSDHKLEVFKIVHKITCDDRTRSSSWELDRVIGSAGVGTLINFLHPGQVTDPSMQSETEVSDIPKFAEIFRRLQTPYYEEARMYMQEALADGRLDSNPAVLGHTDTLKAWIEDYSKSKA